MKELKRNIRQFPINCPSNSFFFHLSLWGLFPIRKQVIYIPIECEHNIEPNKKYDNNAYYALIARHANNTRLHTYVRESYDKSIYISICMSESKCEGKKWTTEIHPKNALLTVESVVVVGVVCLVRWLIRQTNNNKIYMIE